MVYTIVLCVIHQYSGLYNQQIFLFLFFENFSSDHKFDSGTGWPSFYSPYNPAAIATKTDYALLSARTEVHCAKV
jgi:peptide methionine sulfoxide reductase MsrB